MSEKIKEEQKTENECQCQENCQCHQEEQQKEKHECHCNSKKEDKKEHKCKKEIKNLEEELKKITEINADLVNKVKLAQAELVNYRKRKDEETNSLLKYANQDLILELIPIVDNFERAIKLDDNDLTDELSKFLAGFKMMYASLTELLKKFGVEEINRVGEIFDPNQEQALLTDCIEEMEDEAVIEVLLKGYKLKDRVIRPASVKINQK